MALAVKRDDMGMLVQLQSARLEAQTYSRPPTKPTGAPGAQLTQGSIHSQQPGLTSHYVREFTYVDLCQYACRAG